MPWLFRRYVWPKHNSEYTGMWLDDQKHLIRSNFDNQSSVRYECFLELHQAQSLDAIQLNKALEIAYTQAIETCSWSYHVVADTAAEIARTGWVEAAKCDQYKDPFLYVWDIPLYWVRCMRFVPEDVRA